MAYTAICEECDYLGNQPSTCRLFAVSEVSGGSDCNLKANSGTETDAAKLIFIW